MASSHTASALAATVGMSLTAAGEAGRLSVLALIATVVPLIVVVPERTVETLEAIEARLSTRYLPMLLTVVRAEVRASQMA